jgi:DNA-binding MarR family transcriptional regulator
MQQLWALTHALEVRSKRMARSIGVTGPQRLVIRIIGQSPDISARNLAAILDMHPSTLTGVLARLEAAGLISRKTAPEDRRRACFRLTPAGRRVDTERKGTVEGAVRRALGRADQNMIDKTENMLKLLVAELVRDEG